MINLTIDHRKAFQANWLEIFGAMLRESEVRLEKQYDNQINFNDKFGKGIMKHWVLPDGIAVFYNNYFQSAHVRYHMPAEPGDTFYSIYFNLNDYKAVGADTANYKCNSLVTYCMSDKLTEIEVTANTKIHGLHLWIKKDVFSRCLSAGTGDQQAPDTACDVLKPENFGGTFPLNTKLVHPILKLSRYHGKEDVGEFKISAYVYEIIAHTVSTLLSKYHNEESPVSWELFLLVDVIDQILDNMESERFPPIVVAAKRACMSETKFKKLFKQYYQTTYFKYLQRMMLLKVKDRLACTPDNITAIVKRFGYKNIGHFASLFKKEFSLNPHKYRSALHRRM